MSHGLEISLDGFKTAFASRQEPAWHQLGQYFEGDYTRQQILDEAYLSGWDVRAEPLAYPEGYRPVKEYQQIIRTNPFDQGLDVLGIVGERYRVFQNEELAEFGDAIVHEGGRWETAGSISDGRRVFMSLAMPDDIVLDPNGRADTIKTYLLLTSSHDGTGAIMAANTPVRVVCQNTLNFALSGVKQSFKIRHTQTAEGKVQAAREALQIQVAYNDVFQAEAEAMIQKEMDESDFFNIIADLYPKPEKGKASDTRWHSKIERLEDILEGRADGPDTAINIRGTAWSGLNAVTEAIDWYRQPKSGKPESVLAAASGFDPITNAEKNRIKSRFMAFATA